MSGLRPLPLSSWLRLLADDSRILLSWFVLIGTGVYSAYTLSGNFGAQPTEYNNTRIWQYSLLWAYWGWAMYWGAPACLGFLRRGVGRLLSHGFSPATIIASFFYIGFAMVVLFHYPSFGGGIYHFFKRWRDAARHLPPPPVNVPVQSPVYAPPPMLSLAPDVEHRLEALADLLRRGLITQHEHDQQRMNILRSM